MSTVAFSLAGGFVNEITPYLINATGFWVMIIFALINVGMLAPIYLFYIGKTHSSSRPIMFDDFMLFTAKGYSIIETANRHLEDMDLLFASDSNISWRAEKEFELSRSRTIRTQTEEMG